MTLTTRLNKCLFGQHLGGPDGPLRNIGCNTWVVSWKQKISPDWMKRESEPKTL